MLWWEPENGTILSTMSKILAISSQTIFGPVGLSASLPALQSQGHEVLNLPTITLSHHPGHGKPSGQRNPGTLMQEMLDGLTQIGALDNVEGVLTGYFADAEQVKVAATAIAKLKPRHILVDPVMGDHGALYVPQAVAKAIRDQLMPLATIITPNLFELQWLAQETDIQKAVAELKKSETLVTSVPADDDHLATELHVDGGRHVHAFKRRDSVPHGTGDFLAGLYLACRMSEGPATAFTKAMTGLERVIAASTGSSSLQVATITAAR
jgi:pyridoxine kinase